MLLGASKLGRRTLIKFSIFFPIPELQRTPPPVCRRETVVLWRIFAALTTGEWPSQTSICCVKLLQILMSICLCGNRKTANVYVPPSLHFWHLIFLETTMRVIVLNKIYLICSMHVYITFRCYLFVVVAGLCHKISIATTWH